MSYFEYGSRFSPEFSVDHDLTELARAVALGGLVRGPRPGFVATERFVVVGAPIEVVRDAEVQALHATAPTNMARAAIMSAEAQLGAI